MLDGGDQVVHLFDATGAYERTIGRPGRGPGEFELAYALAVRSDTLIVDDAARRHFVKFSRAGEFIANAPAPAAMDDAVAFVPRMAYRVRGTREGRHIVELRLAADSGFSTVVGQPDTLRRSITFERCGIRISLPPVFAPEFEWAAGGEHLVVSRSVDYSIEVYHADSLVSILRRNLPSLEATESLALEEIGDGEQITVGNGKTCTIPPQEVVRKRGYYPVVPPIKRIALDPGGYIWVMRTEASAGRPAIDIVHIRDGYIGTLPPDFPWPEAFGPGDVFASLELDSLDVPTIGYYTITR